MYSTCKLQRLQPAVITPWTRLGTTIDAAPSPCQLRQPLVKRSTCSITCASKGYNGAQGI
eukprot:7218806-Pyramimonas_sp.AAC.1